MPFEKMDHFCQLGTDLREEAPVHLLMIGRSADGQQCMALTKLEYLGKETNEITISNIDISPDFDQLRD